jgi:hypothetical protein
VEFAKTAIRLKYKTLYDAHAWRESMRVFNITLDPSLNGVFFLPYDAEEMIFVKLSRDGVNYTRLNYRERDWIERVWATTLYSLPGNFPFYYRSENLAWPYAGPGQLTFTTSDLTPFTAFIEGKDYNGNPLSESFILNGTLQADGITVTPGVVTTKGVYKFVTSLSKDSGNLTVSDSASGKTIGLGQAASQLIFSQYVLYPPLIWNDPDGTVIPYSVQCQAKLKPDTLDNDMSVPRISHIWDALIEFTLSALYTRARQLTKADAREQKAIQHVQAAVNVEKNQSENRQQVVPTVYETGDYLGLYGHGTYATSSYPFGI